jgi:hypothetical protein
MRPNPGRWSDFIAGLAHSTVHQTCLLRLPEKKPSGDDETTVCVDHHRERPDAGTISFRRMREGRRCTATLLTRAVALIHR